MIENLRKVEFKIAKDVWVGDTEQIEIIKKIGYFHKWINEACVEQGYSLEFQYSMNYALIEDEEGNVLMIKPTEIKFIK